MSLTAQPARETGMEVDDIDGFRFMSFQEIEEVHRYLKHIARPEPATQLSRRNLTPPKVRAAITTKNVTKSAKVARSSTSSSSSAKPSKAVSKAKPGNAAIKKVPVWLKHKRRLRKSDKRVIVDRFHGFVFASAFTLDDFDACKEEIAKHMSPAAAVAGAKRKASPGTSKTTVVTGVKKWYKRGLRTEELDGDMHNSGNLVTSNLVKNGAKQAGKKFEKVAWRNASKHAGKSDAIPASLGMSNLDKLVTFTSSIVPPINNALLSMADQAREPSRPGQHVAETETSATQRNKNRKRQYPHMQIDETYDRAISSPSGSESSVITISDDGPDQENIILDVINVDDELSSAQFIQDSIKIVNHNQPGEVPNDTSLESNKSNKDKAKKKKCRICCIYPSKIVEAKKIGPLFGSYFPSYTVSCVSTCKQHPPGEIIVLPSTSKPGCVDTCIQTNAPDIRMNLDFAHRFPHRTIAITTHCSKMLTQPTPRTKRARFFNKSEHHRTSEQRRREQMHDQFTDLRRMITTSQAIPDNERASKQWILEHAMTAITSLEAESTVLMALKKTVAAKNERLKRKWSELSGKEFDTNKHRGNIPAESSAQTTLIDLYKQYRKNVQRKNSNNTNGVEFNQSAVTTQKKITTSKNQSGGEMESQAVVEKNTNEVSLVRQSSSGANTGNQSGGEMVTDAPEQIKSKQAASGNVVGQDLPTSEAECRNPASQVITTSQVTSLNRPSDDACTIMERASEDVVFTKPNQASSAVSANPGTNNPSPKVAVNTSQTITGTQNNSSQSSSSDMLNQPCTPIIPVSSQLSIPEKLSSHPRDVRNPNLIVRMPSQAATTSVSTSSQPAMPVTQSSRPRSARMSTHTMTTSVPPSCQQAVPGKLASHPAAENVNPTVVKLPTIALRMPNSKATTQFIAVSRPSQQTGPRLLIPLSKLNQALMTRKPTQWTAMSKLNQQEVNKLHVEDVGAVVEVGGGEADDNMEKHKNDIVLLDVAQTVHKSASSEQGRTLSLIPTSSSINVTLKSVGSITSNKIFNKKPVPSKQKSLVGLQVDQTNHFLPKDVNETNASKQKNEVHLTPGPALEPTFGQVPQISATLLAQTFQDDRNIKSGNETGLCIISNVFSLSNVETGNVETDNVEPDGTSQPAMDSGNCDKADSGIKEQLGKTVDVNCNSTTHDHNYSIKKRKTNLVTHKALNKN